MTHSIDKLQHKHLPSMRQAMDTLYERVTYGLVTDADGAAMESAMQHAEDELTSLAQYLSETGLAGMPLTHKHDMQQAVRALFEQRARLSDATTMVASILEKRT